MSELVQASGSRYSDEERLCAAAHYASLGVYSKVAEQTGIPDRTLREWGKQDWFISHVAELRDINKDRRIVQYDEIMDLAHAQVLDRLPEASARDAMIIMATAQDKGRILMSLPNAYSAGTEGISSLARQFAELSAQWQEKQVRVIETVEKRD